MRSKFILLKCITLIFLLFCLFIIKSVFSLNILPVASSPFNTIDLFELDNQIFGIHLSIGYPPQKFLFMFDTTSEYTWVRGSSCLDCTDMKVFKEKDSETLFRTNTSISWREMNEVLKGEIAYDYLNIKIFSANNMPFLIVNEDYFMDGVDGIIGFGFGSNSDINFSILDKLKENNQIKQRVFTMQLHEEISTNIFIGKIPDHIQNDIGNLTVCNVNTTLHSWNCKISHLLIGSEINFYKAIPININAIFASTGNNIVIPQSYIQFFIQKYFETYPNYESKFCYIKPDGRKYFILCNMKYFDINKAPFLSFVINGYAYKIPPEDLFQQLFSDAYNQYYFFKIVFMETPDSHWILGTNFLKQYEVVFNKETKQVGFYGGSKYDFTKFTRDTSELVCLYNFFMYVFLFVLVGGSMGYILYKKQKENEIASFNLVRENSKNNNKLFIKDEKELQVYNN
jgi:hypothetical protein